MPPQLHLLYSLSGFLVGFLVGLTGVGGGSLMTPLLVLLFGVQANVAVGTDLLYAAITKTVGVTVHGARRTVDWTIVARLASGSAPAAAVTLALLAMFERRFGSPNHLITVVLGAALIVTAISLFFRGRLVGALAQPIADLGPRGAAALTVLLGAILGVLVSLSSVGAGAIGVTVLLILYPRLPLNRLVGSDIAHAVPLALIAGVGHWIIGDANLGLVGWLLLGSIPGIVIGSLIASRIPDSVLRPVLASTLAVVGGRLFF